VKLAFVVQRYGADIAGGSEAHCRLIAQRLSPRHDITVLTTCARDYVTWANALPAGEQREDGVRVLRFPVRRQRRLKTFADISDEVFDGTTSPDRQHDWFAENGPDAPALLDHLRDHGREYDLVVFWTYRYAPSYFGLPLVADRAVLVPTAEDDPAIDLGVLQEFFRTPAGYVFLTPEEQALVTSRAGNDLEPSTIIGIGVDSPAPVNASPALARHSIPPDFLLYLGRVDRNKGCDTLLEYFQDYASRHTEGTLVLAGPAKMQIPAHPRIRALGYVPDDLRDALLASARALIVPSPYESLSIVLLEAWNYGTPALVNARCAVLKGQTVRADGGLYYRDRYEFSEALDYLLAHPDVARRLGSQGREYVDREYRWPTVMRRIEGLLAAVGAAPH